MAKTNEGLVAYVKAQLGLPYWYGTFGNTATKELYSTKQKQYPNYYTQSKYKVRFDKQYGQRVHDCVGLVKGYLWSDTPTSKPKYNSAQDVSANGMLSKCKENGKIATLPEIAGVLVFFNGHVGVYIGNGYVVEARGHDYGVVKTLLSERPWTNWGKCPWIEYNTADTFVSTYKKSINEIANEIISGKWGSGDIRKKKLTDAGYDYNEVQAKVNSLVKSDSKLKITYFKKYTGKSTSIVDALNSLGVTSTFAYRKKIASANNIKVYTGLPSQNQKMLGLLKQGKLIKP